MDSQNKTTEHLSGQSFIQAAGKSCTICNHHLASHIFHVMVAEQFGTKLVLTFPRQAPQSVHPSSAAIVSCGCSAAGVLQFLNYRTHLWARPCMVPSRRAIYFNVQALMSSHFLSYFILSANNLTKHHLSFDVAHVHTRQNIYHCIKCQRTSLKGKKKSVSFLIASGDKRMQEAPWCARSICSGDVQLVRVAVHKHHFVSQ